MRFLFQTLSEVEGFLLTFRIMEIIKIENRKIKIRGRRKDSLELFSKGLFLF